MILLKYIIPFALILCTLQRYDAKRLDFPRNFAFGVSSSSYQIEGAWNIDGKTQSIWDYATHTFPNTVIDETNGDTACKSYEKLDEDVKNIANLNVDFYRFSLSWPRILPDGFNNKINKLGINYYNRLINKLLDKNIEPVITMYHWELPQSLQDLGGVASPLFSDWFADFARVCFKLFGDRVKTWITLNEPTRICNGGYGDGDQAPHVKSDYFGRYLCGHNVILAHAKAYDVYQKEFVAFQNGKVGITVESTWFEPYNSSIENVRASERLLQHYLGWFLHPILINGEYPPIMRYRIDKNSALEGFEESRLPRFTDEERAIVRHSADFVGLNHYTTVLVRNRPKANQSMGPSYRNDVNIIIEKGPAEWPGTARDLIKVVPWGMRKLLNWIKREYRNPPVLITENGFPGFQNETTDDIGRQNYIKGYLNETAKALLWDYCNVIGYSSWSLMDSFEWSYGYTLRYGLYHVDFTKDDRPRTPKGSANLFREIIQKRTVE